MERTNKPAGFVAMTLVILIYGVSYLSREAIGAYISAGSVVAIQMGIMAVLFTLYNLALRKSFRINKRDIIWIVLSGLFGTTFFQGLTILSTNSLGATVSSLLFGFAAAFALLVEILLFHRKKTALGIVSILISIAGIYVIMDMNLNDLASTNFKGYLLGIGSVASWVIYTFLCDKISTDYDKTVVLNYQAFIGLITSIPFLLVNPVPLELLGEPVIFGNLLVLGLLNSTLSYFLNMYALKQIGVTLANLFLNFLPVATILLALILFQTVPSGKEIIGGLMILASVFMLNKDQENVTSKNATPAEE